MIMKTLKLTPEWVLEKLPHSYYSDGKGNNSIYTGNAANAALIELALNSLNIASETYYYVDSNNEILFGFDFRIEGLKSDCPTLHKEMKRMDVNTKIYKQLNNI
jgi:hypothetical protein